MGVKRAMNRAPCPNDNWWSQHQNTCGGTYTKVKEPENYGRKKTGDKRKKEIPKVKGQPGIQSAFPKVPKKENIPGPSGIGGSKNPSTNRGGGPKGNIFGFGGLSFAPPDEKFGGLKTKGKSGAYVQNPGWKSEDNSSSGHVIKSSSTNSKNPGKTSDDSNVKDQLRKIWANKFDQKSENEPKRSEKSEGEGELVNCPVCSAAMPASRIN